MTNSKSNRCRKSISSSERKLWNGGLQQEINESKMKSSNNAERTFSPVSKMKSKNKILSIVLMRQTMVDRKIK